MQKRIETMLQEQGKIEEACLDSCAQGPEKIETEYRKAQINTSESTLARLFLKHFQLIQGKRIEAGHILRNDADLLADLRVLDTKSIRYPQVVPLLYYKSGISHQYEGNYGLDPGFNELLSSLGIVLQENHMRTGNFDRFKDLIVESGVVYSSGLLSEQLFVVPSIRLANRSVKV